MGPDSSQFGNPAVGDKNVGFIYLSLLYFPCFPLFMGLLC
uniref:Uncharacterized protein n=1 Tax=Ciona intestinalis TaxID=7719 RepID=H2XTG2_CIOIN